MKSKHKSLDRISGLPQDAVENILSHMPIRDAVRTSILSKKWRYCWTRMPKLVFNDKLVNESADMAEEINKYKLVNAIFHVLLLHRGSSISELCISIAYADIVDEIDQIILHLSWTKNIKKFVFETGPADEFYKLRSSFFSLQGLEHLSLRYCDFELPLTFNGFSMLKSLYFEDVTINANTLQRFLTSCPLLEEFTMDGDIHPEFTGGTKCTFADLFKCLPSVQVVNISWDYFEDLAAGGMPRKLPTSLVYLRILVLGVCFQKLDGLSSTLCLINSSPNLETIRLKIFRDDEQTFTTLLDPQDYSGLKLDHLKELEITSFHNYATEMEFVKLIMAKSPVLKKARIVLWYGVSVDEEVAMLRDLIHLPFPRASPAAEFIIERPKSYL